MADSTITRSDARAAAKRLVKAAELIGEARDALNAGARETAGFTRTHFELAATATASALAHIDDALSHARAIAPTSAKKARST